MSEDRKQAGDPVEQVESAAEDAVAEATASAEDAGAAAADTAAAGTAAASAAAAQDAVAATERPVIAAITEPPSASKLETAEEIFAAHPTHGGSLRDEEAMRATSSQDTAPQDTAPQDAAPQDAAPYDDADAGLPPVRDGEIRISADHPMAALYMQTPMPPEIKGNRGAGVLIALLSTFAFALVYAGVLALWIAPSYPPSTFLSEGLLPWILNWGFAAAAIGFFIGFALLVLVVGRAGWWAYVLGGLLVALFTWAVALAGFALDARLGGEAVKLHPFALLADYGLYFPVLAAGIVAREVSVWFGAWIGARGRKIKRQNAEAITAYETALAEVQAK